MQTLFKTAISIYLFSITFTLFLYPLCSLFKAPEQHRLPPVISVYRTENGTVTTIPFEHYVTYVVACEISSSFHPEALKAQAIASRTYAAAKIQSSKSEGCPAEHPIAPVCDSTHCQVYKDYSEIKTNVDLDKIITAVKETESQLLYYDGNLVNDALFHASSGGKTENSEDVFISAVPYLRSVSSPYEYGYPRNGHGVGMSQQGADGMAKAGCTYKDILTHYYTGTYIR